MTPESALPASARWRWLLLAAGGLAIALHFALQGAAWPLLAVLVLGGIPLAVQILLRLARGDFGADLLAALALGTAAWQGQYLAAVLIVLMLAGGQALESYALRRASSVLQALAQRLPARAHRRRGEHIEEIAPGDIAIGDEIVIFPHETAPADGTVIDGHGGMDESYLTGEPYRVSKAPGAAVLSGAVNGDSALVIRAEKRPQDSRYAQIMRVMAEAEQKRPGFRRLGDRLGALFAPLALLFALAAWHFSGDATRFLAVLVVATPCPLLIAIPVTLISAISMAARRGIIIKDPAVLERLPTCRTAIFDKTGTLTYGQPELTEILPAAAGTEDMALRLAASLERYSRHPLATAILQAAARKNLPLAEAASLSEKPGQGLSGRVEGHELRVTHRKMLLQSSPDVAALLPPSAPGLECVILIDGRYAATFRFRDTPRAGGRSFVSHLAPAHRFDKVMLVSGDRESEVSHLAQLLGIREALAAQSPEQKLAIVRAETARAPTLFMGDGINDAPALAAATAGIAFGLHGSITAEAAGAVVMDSSLARVDELIHLSDALRRNVLQSALGGMGLSLLAMGFAAAGMLTPVQGALLQEGIDVLAIANALRLAWGSRIRADLEG